MRSLRITDVTSVDFAKQINSRREAFFKDLEGGLDCSLVFGRDSYDGE